MGTVGASKDDERSKQSLLSWLGGVPGSSASEVDKVHLAKAFHIRLFFKVIIHMCL